MNISSESLSDAEIHVLDEFLMSDSTPEDVFTIDELHGYLTAIIAALYRGCRATGLLVSGRVRRGRNSNPTSQRRKSCR